MTLLFIKLLSTAIIVVALSVVAEKSSPKLAGILSGLPLGAAIVLFFLGLEQGAVFAGEAGIAMVLGLTSSLVFLTSYWLCSQFLFRQQNLVCIALTSMVSILAFIATTGLLSLVPNNPIICVAITVFSCISAIVLFQRIPNTQIQQAIRFTPKVLFTRAFIATLIVVLITGSANLLGSFVSGLLAGFPITLFPLLLIVHLTYSANNTWSIIKNFPLGMGSLIIYGIAVFHLYPLFGVSVGTLLSLAAALSYTVLLMQVLKKLAKPKRA